MSHKSARLLTLAMFLVGFGATQVLGQVIYNNIPSPVPGNLVSQAFEAQSASEFGDRVQFSVGSGRKLTAVTQVMSSWGCESGHWYTGDCVTTPGATFSHAITLNIYNVGPGASVGTLIGSVTQTFAIPYRPSADNTNCTLDNAGKWFDGTTCYNGFATLITFSLNGLEVPDEVIYSIAYNTSHYGASPIGNGASCYTSSGGCGYDSLNVAVLDSDIVGLPNVGVNPGPNDAYLSSTWAGAYCPGPGVVGVFRLDPGCWTGYKPAVRFNAANPPVTADDCKKLGWETRTTVDGEPFKNQGQCVSYVKP